MANLSWGKPKLEIVKLEQSTDLSSASWTEIATPVENTTKLNTEKGEKKEAKIEGGEVIDVKVGKSKYSLEFELYAQKGKEKPIADEDGVILDHYAIRLTPEDKTNKGLMIKKAAVSVETTWDSEIGEKWKYTFEALKPAEGKMVEPYSAL